MDRAQTEPRTAQRLKRDIVRLLQDESGLTTIEYALLIALLAVGAILAYRHFGLATSDLATESTRQLPGAGQSPADTAH